MKSKFAAGLLSLLVAFGLWTYVINNVSKEETLSLDDVPVLFQNEGALAGNGLVMTGGTGQTVDLTVTGYRSELMKLNSSNVTVVVDLSRLYDAGRQSLQYTVHYPADVDSSSFVYTADRSRITLTLENLIDAKVPVVVQTSGTPAEGYRIFPETQTLSETYINVSGPASVVGQVTQAVIYVDLEGATQSIRNQAFDFALCDAEGNPVEVPNVEQVVTDVSQVELNLTIQGYKYVLLAPNVIDGKGATEETSSIVCSPEGIWITGSDEALASVETITLASNIDLGQYLEDQTITVPIKLPEGITSLSEEDEVEVSISFPELMTKTFTMTNIQPVNVPAGMIPNINTTSVTVTVRGPSVVVQRMTEAAITVSVDFGGLSIGVPKLVEPIITISSTYPGVGIVSNGNVTIVLEEPVPETTGDPMDPTEANE